MRKGFTLIELMIVIAIIAIIAAIAIPNLLESRVTANEAAASATMKSGVFPAQAQFQGGTYQDADRDNRGEYGTIEALSGLIPTTKIEAANLATQRITLVTGPLSSGAAIGARGVRNANGYAFMAAFPASLANASDTDADAVVVEGEAMPADIGDAAFGWESNPAESYFVVGAMPERYGDTGRKVFVMASDGQIRTPNNNESIEEWYAGPPANGAAATEVLLGAGMGHFLNNAEADVTDVGATTSWSRPLGIPSYPTVSK